MKQQVLGPNLSTLHRRKAVLRENMKLGVKWTSAASVCAIRTECRYRSPIDLWR